MTACMNDIMRLQALHVRDEFGVLQASVADQTCLSSMGKCRLSSQAPRLGQIRGSNMPHCIQQQELRAPKAQISRVAWLTYIQLSLEGPCM